MQRSPGSECLFDVLNTRKQVLGNEMIPDTLKGESH
jgi:hypothetical protein